MHETNKRKSLQGQMLSKRQEKTDTLKFFQARAPMRDHPEKVPLELLGESPAAAQDYNLGSQENGLGAPKEKSPGAQRTPFLTSD